MLASCLQLLLSGAEWSKEMTQAVTHIIVDSACEKIVQTPEDFLNCITRQAASDFSFEEMKEAIERHHLFIVSCK